MSNVSNIVKTIQDIMRKDAGTYGDAQRIEQIAWLFFLKIFDDREKEMDLLRDNYKSPLPKNLRWSDWATDEEGITGDALLDSSTTPSCLSSRHSLAQTGCTRSSA
jgi:type I restriction enzyme M protein